MCTSDELSRRTRVDSVIVLSSCSRPRTGEEEEEEEEEADEEDEEQEEEREEERKTAFEVV